MAKLRLRSLMAAFFMIVLGLARCGPHDGAAVAQPGELWGRTFVSVSVPTGSRLMRLVPGTRVTLALDEGGLNADAGCNYMSGAVSLDGGRLSAPDLAQTAMSCGSPMDRQDNELAKFLSANPRWRLDHGELILTEADTELRLTDTRRLPRGHTLEDTRWFVESAIREGISVTSSHDQFAYLGFGADDQVEGSTGCNALLGKARPTGRKIHFSNIHVGRRPCPRQSRALEAAVVNVLSGDATYRIEGDLLVLSSRGQALHLRATR